MKWIVARTLAALFGMAATCFVATASADDADTDISGHWTFETGAYNDSCRIYGRMTIFPTDGAGKYRCEFTTFEDCPGLSAEVEQVCDARVDDGQVAIGSKIRRINRQEPMAYGYAPDDWLLTIRSEDEMTGTLESASRAQVIFKRQSIPVS